MNRKTNELEFENAAMHLPLETQTAWKRKDGKGFYSLGSLWLQLVMKDAKLSDYSKEAAKLNIKQASFMDKKLIIDFFTGVAKESSQIDGSIRA